MNLVNLDEVTRQYMRAEAQSDIDRNRLYTAQRLTPQGTRAYPDLLLDAIDRGTPASLTGELRRNGRIYDQEPYTRSGVTRYRNVPYTAAETLAEGEFNRYYIRGVCLRAIAEGIPHVQVYRAKAVVNPRPESTAKIGQWMDPSTLLDDLRTNNSVESLNTVFGVPAGPNSGLSVHFPTEPSQAHDEEPGSSPEG